MGEESHIEKLFKNMDKNGDGFVTKQVQSWYNFLVELLKYFYFYSYSSYNYIAYFCKIQYNTYYYTPILISPVQELRRLAGPQPLRQELRRMAGFDLLHYLHWNRTLRYLCDFSLILILTLVEMVVLLSFFKPRQRYSLISGWQFSCRFDFRLNLGIAYCSNFKTKQTWMNSLQVRWRILPKDLNPTVLTDCTD